MTDEENYPDDSAGSVSFLGLNKKPKKKQAGTPGLLQSQLNNSQDKQPGALAMMAQNQGALGSASQGVMAETTKINKKKLMGVS